MKKLTRIGALLLSALIVTSSCITTQAKEDYTYNYDWWGDVQCSPDAYNVTTVLMASALGLDKGFSSPKGLFVIGDMMYICDTGNNRIVQVERTGTETFKLVRVFDEFKGNVDNTTFNNPTDIAVSAEGDIYICDQNNARVLKLDKDLNYLMEFNKPVDANFDPSVSFLPNKLVIDTAGRVFCSAVNVNKGLIKYEPDGTFAGFMGANQVSYDWTDYVWKRLASKEQRAQLESFVPTEYENIYMDHEGFIYAVTSKASKEDIDSGAVAPVKRMNMLGTDILVRNGEIFVGGDIYWQEGAGYEGPSRMTDVTALENDTYVALDKNRGRLFAYNDQGILLWAFGSNGNIDGYFKAPVAIEHMGHDLFVLDSQDCSITVFTPTMFGSLVFQAIEQFQAGEYEESGITWQKVMDLNGNYDLAYIGIGRALLRQEKYHEAMEYFELKWDGENYSRAFKQYRKQWVEEHIVLIFLAVFLVLCLPLIIGKIKKIKHEIDTADIFKV